MTTTQPHLVKGGNINPKPVPGQINYQQPARGSAHPYRSTLLLLAGLFGIVVTTFYFVQQLRAATHTIITTNSFELQSGDVGLTILFFILAYLLFTILLTVGYCQRFPDTLLGHPAVAAVSAIILFVALGIVTTVIASLGTPTYTTWGQSHNISNLPFPQNADNTQSKHTIITDSGKTVTVTYSIINDENYTITLDKP